MKHLLLTTIAAVLLVTTAFAGPIHDAARNGDLAGVQAELDKGADLNAKDESGYTPLYGAVEKGHKEVVELLIAAGADVNVKAARGWTPLHLAASEGHKEVAELLIAKSADVNAKDEDGYAPLHIAAWMDHKEIVELLIAAGADVNAQDGEGFTPLDMAVITAGTSPPEFKTGLEETVKLLRKQGGISGAADSINVAAAVGNTEAVKQHLAAGVDVNAKTDYGYTPLIHAVEIGNKEIVELLIAEGADVNVKVDWMIEGSTLLHQTASFWGYNKEIAELLIANGADVNAKDGEGSTPLDNLVNTVEWWILTETWGGVSMGEEAWSQATELTDFLRKHGGMTSEELLMPRLNFTRSPFGFTFNTIEGKMYRVESGIDLKKWNKLREINGTGNEAKFIDMRRIYFPQHFYRVVVVD